MGKFWDFLFGPDLTTMRAKAEAELAVRRAAAASRGAFGGHYGPSATSGIKPPSGGSSVNAKPGSADLARARTDYKHKMELLERESLDDWRLALRKKDAEREVAFFSTSLGEPYTPASWLSGITRRPVSPGWPTHRKWVAFSHGFSTPWMVRRYGHATTDGITHQNTFEDLSDPKNPDRRWVFVSKAGAEMAAEARNRFEDRKRQNEKPLRYSEAPRPFQFDSRTAFGEPNLATLYDRWKLSVRMAPFVSPMTREEAAKHRKAFRDVYDMPLHFPGTELRTIKASDLGTLWDKWDNARRVHEAMTAPYSGGKVTAWNLADCYDQWLLDEHVRRHGYYTSVSEATLARPWW